MPLTAEQKLIGRRNFLKAAAVLPVVGGVAYKAFSVGPVKTGIVGTGMEGRVLISQADPKYLYINTLCDIRPDNRELGKEMIKSPTLGHDPNPTAYENYDDMLNKADIEAVIIATPLHTHAPLALKALKAGKHVFVEKTMAYSLDECREMIRLAETKGLNLQIGHQRFYNPLYWDARKMLQDGLLGNVYHVRALWHRNSDWNYWPFVWDYADHSMQSKLKAMDTKRYGYPDLQHLVNWRWYNETSHGLWTELCSHQIAVTNWLFDSMPTAVYATGGNFKCDADQNALYEKHRSEFEILQKYNDTSAKSFDEFRLMKKGYQTDDRTISDHIYALFEYPQNRVVSYSSIQSSGVDKYYEEIMGTRGTIILSNENESYLFWEPGWDETKAEKAAKEEKSTQIEITSEDISEAAFAGHVSEEATGSGGASDMEPYAPYRWELQGFAHTIRTGFPNLCDGRRGAQAAAACLYGKESLEKRKRIEIPSSVVV